MSRLIECVPNFSEGRDKDVIDAIAKAISNVADVKVITPFYLNKLVVIEF